MKETKMVLGDGDEKVVCITVFRANREQRELSNRTSIVGFGGVQPSRQHCPHRHVSLDTSHAELECDDCKHRLNPIEWIANHLDHWHWIQRKIDEFKETERRAAAAMTALELRQRAKCEHCGGITRVRIHR
jgi:hypothetical protein